MNFYGIDDHIDDLNPLLAILNKFSIANKTTDDANEFMNDMASAKRSDILLSDGLMEEVVVSLDGVSKPSLIKAETAGYSLLSKGYEGVRAKALTRIILSVHDLTKGIANQIKRQQKLGVTFEYINKSDENYLGKFEKVVKSHIIHLSQENLEKKLSYVSDVIDGWTDEEEVKLSFFGITAATKAFKDLVESRILFGKDEDIEARCDAIYRIKVNLTNVYGPTGLEKEKKWLNRPSKYFDGKSPMELIRTGRQHELYHILSVLEQD